MTPLFDPQDEIAAQAATIRHLQAEVDKRQQIVDAARELLTNFVKYNGGWWKPNPAKTSHDLNDALDRLAAALEQAEPGA